MKAILDTSVLLTLYSLNLFQYLMFLYDEVRIPREVEREFLYNIKDFAEQNKRFDFISNFYEKHRVWCKPCNEYGSDLVALYLSNKKIDKGEAEVFAQNQALGSVYELLLDENEGRKVAKSQQWQHHGVLYILAKLEIRLQLCDYYKSLRILKSKGIGRFSEDIIKQVYEIEKLKQA